MRTIGVIALLLLAGPAAAGTRDLATCPALVPLAPIALPGRRAARCQHAIGAAARRLVGRTLDAVDACLARVQTGELAGDPTALCVPQHRPSNGVYVAPTDAKTAERVVAATLAMARMLERRCAGAAVGALGACGAESVAGACVVRDHLEHLAHVVDATHGALPPSPSRETRACQVTVARAGRAFVVDLMRAHAACLDRYARAPASLHRGRRCLGQVDASGFIPPEDGRTAARVRAAGAKLARRLRACTDGALAALDACGQDRTGLASCLGCTLGREALLLVQGERGGVADGATTHFVDWAGLRNPVLGLEDRAIKDQALVYRDGAFYVFASQRFEATDPALASKVPYVFRTTDFRSWDELPWPWDATAAGAISAGSPDVTLLDGTWYATFQAKPPAASDPDAREIFLSTSPDLLGWSPVAAITAGLVANPIIDGALARADGYFFLLFKDRAQQLPHVTRSATTALDGAWLPPQRAIAGSSEPFTGFAENYQAIAVDGRQRVVATGRDPERNRCGNVLLDIYTCSHEPYLYEVPGAGAALEGWTAWTRRRPMLVPYEAWNTIMHANTGFLSDWRAADGFFYLSFAGAADGTSFDLRGHGRIGLARSRDLVHWRVPGDLRD